MQKQKTKTKRKYMTVKRLKRKQFNDAVAKYCAMITLLLIIPCGMVTNEIKSLNLSIDEPVPFVMVNYTKTEEKGQDEEDLKDLSVTGGTIRQVTMYSSRPEETDSTPCIGATGQDVCDLWAKGINICASNAFPLHTVIKVDKLGECLVIDRMNKRYTNRIDWYAGFDIDCLDGLDEGDKCDNYERAVNFGLQNLRVTKI